MKKKHILIAVFAAFLSIMVAFSSNAFAAEGKDVTIEGVRTGDEVRLCKIIDITKDDSNNTVKREFVSSITGEDIDAYSKLTGQALQEKVWELVSHVKDDASYSKTVEPGQTSVVFDNVEPGQYVVLGIPNTPKTTYQITTVTVDYKANDSNGYDVVVNPDTIVLKTTELKEPEKELVDKDGANRGEEISYKVTATVPTYPEDATYTKFMITDDMAQGKLINPSIVSVKLNEVTIPEAAYSVKYTNNGKDSKFEIDFNYKTLIETAAAGTKITITYKATIDSVNETDGTLVNKATETINPNPYVSGEYTTDPSEAKTNTFGLVLKKVNAENKDEGLSGAQFGLYKDGKCTDPVLVDGNPVILKTDANGYAAQNGIKKGEYWIKELVAPAGFRLDSTVRKVTLSDKSAVADNPITESQETNFYNIGEIENNTTPTLPITGGTGTALLTFVGVGLMGSYFVAARKNKQ